MNKPTYQRLLNNGARTALKSDARVLRLLEYFSRIDREVTVMEVARNLNFPHSSTWQLLHRLTEEGYLTHDPRRRIYLPTARIALLGAQLIPQMFGDCRILEMIDELCKFTSAPVFLVGRNASTVQIIQMIRNSGMSSPVENTGLKYPIVTATPGRLILSMAPENHVRDLVRRHNANNSSINARVDLQQYLDELVRIRSRGYAVSRDTENVPLPINRSNPKRWECIFKEEGRLALPLTGVTSNEFLAITLRLPSSIGARGEQDYARNVAHIVGRYTKNNENLSV